MEQYGLSIVTAATKAPITLDEAKNYCSVIDETIDDTLIQVLIDSATKYVEDWTTRKLINVTLLMTLDRFPLYVITVPRAPFSVVNSIKYLDSAGDQITLDAADYTVDNKTELGRIVPSSGNSWPQTFEEINAVEIEFVAGYGPDEVDVPDTIKSAIYLTIDDLYNNRSTQIVGTIIAQNQTVQKLLSIVDVAEY